MKHATFLADAALLHELGERLIGRSAIALGELVKNSYDADATICRIEFLDDKVIVTDNGSGMSQEVFLRHWLRIATTHKIDQKTSPAGRALTGSKGIGRLSVQFLAQEMTIESTSIDDRPKSLYVFVDWSQAKRGQELSAINVDYDLQNKHPEYPGESSTGMQITLKGLKTTWGVDELKEVGADVWMLRSPFKHTTKGDSNRADEFDVQLEAPHIVGARDAFDERLKKVLDAWRARIRGTLENGRSGGKATIVIEFLKGYPELSEKAERFSQSLVLPVRKGTRKPMVDRARFEILIYRLTGLQPGRVKVSELKDYLEVYGNVSVYDGGFRLPYYGSGKDSAGQDWLNVAADQGRRLTASELLPTSLQTQTKYMQDLPAPGRIFGAVEIDTNHEREVARRFKAEPDEWLQIQPGRDRLHDNPAFMQLRDLVRFSLDFYANRYRQLALRAHDAGPGSEAPTKKFDRAVRALELNKTEIPSRVYKQLRGELAEARKASVSIEADIDKRAALLGPLASAGMVALALNHELARESTRLLSMGRRLRTLAKKHTIHELTELADQFEQSAQRLDALQDIFSPLLGDTDIAAPERLKVRPIARQMAEAMEVLMPGVNIDWKGIPTEMYFPLGSTAEWSSVFQNVLANAWNAMLDSDQRRISITGGLDKGREWVRISDTGQGLGMPISKADSLFEPFERRLKISKNNQSIAIGGQGLGLAIVRMIVRRRGVQVGFVEPQEGFSTSLQLSWKATRR